MKIRNKTSRSIIIGMGLCLWTMVQPAFASDSEDLKALTKQIEALTKQVSAMHDDVGNLSNRLEKIEAMVPKKKKPTLVSVNLDDAQVMGNKDAKLGILEFTDFQCPFCSHFYQDVLPNLKKSYIDSGEVSFAVRNYPLSFHPHAMNAAIAMRCVREQDKAAFWDMSEELFSHQDKLGKDFYTNLAKQQDLNLAQFKSCQDDPAQKQAIEKELKYAETVGVSGTPTFFVGHVKGNQLVDAVRLEGAQPYTVFAEVIDYVNKNTQVADSKKD